MSTFGHHACPETALGGGSCDLTQTHHAWPARRLTRNNLILSGALFTQQASSMHPTRCRSAALHSRFSKLDFAIGKCAQDDTGAAGVDPAFSLTSKMFQVRGKQILMCNQRFTCPVPEKNKHGMRTRGCITWRLQAEAVIRPQRFYNTSPGASEINHKTHIPFGFFSESEQEDTLAVLFPSDLSLQYTSMLLAYLHDSGYLRGQRMTVDVPLWNVAAGVVAHLRLVLHENDASRASQGGKLGSMRVKSVPMHTADSSRQRRYQKVLDGVALAMTGDLCAVLLQRNVLLPAQQRTMAKRGPSILHCTHTCLAGLLMVISLLQIFCTLIQWLRRWWTHHNVSTLLLSQSPATFPGATPLLVPSLNHAS